MSDAENSAENKAGSNGEQPKKRNVLLLAVAGAVLVVVALGAAAYFVFLNEDEPEAVTLDAAVEDVGGSGDGGSSDTQDTAGTAIAGEWVVDTETGEFNFESATGSFVGFRIDEELANVGANTAVGRTGDVTGSMTLTEDELTAAEFEVQMGTITTDEGRRDNRMKEALKTSEFPTASFEVTEPVALGAGAADGDEISLTATGELTIAGVTKPVEIPIEAQLVDGTVVVTGSEDVLLADYGVEAPTAPLVLGVSDTATVEFQLLFTPS
jgi:polyisoprenoid-binding protein YceI